MGFDVLSKGITIIVKKNGKILRRATGSPKWADLIESMEVLDGSRFGMPGDKAKYGGKSHHYTEKKTNWKKRELFFPKSQGLMRKFTIFRTFAMMCTTSLVHNLKKALRCKLRIIQTCPTICTLREKKK